ncbi:MAG: Holliday junction DNA helicase RuvA [Desulfobacterales bacterium]|nr:Holliday junction DNA helicase RuvA [Desulfobacterales bacterium]MCP4158984.1 Holliday junction DNA helicase RuvA [Deltaproteobacteria bacterium]
MIGYLQGTLLKKYDDQILLLVNNTGYEILIPAFVMESLNEKSKGDEISLFIYFQQTERQPKPVLIGFNYESEKEFFQHFISVEAIGPIKAVKAMNLPVEEIAGFIERNDSNSLKKLTGIGGRTAQKIIATLEGKVSKFTTKTVEKKSGSKNENITEQVFEVLVEQLGHRPVEAKLLIDEACIRNSDINTPEDLFDEIYSGTK